LPLKSCTSFRSWKNKNHPRPKKDWGQTVMISEDDSRSAGVNTRKSACEWNDPSETTTRYFYETRIILSSKPYKESESEVAQSCPTLCDPMDSPTRLLRLWNFPVGCHFLLQGIFLTQGLNPVSSTGTGSHALQADTLPSEPPGKPKPYKDSKKINYRSISLINTEVKIKITYEQTESKNSS